MRHPRMLRALAGSAAAGLALAAVGWYAIIKPDQALVQKRYESTIDIARLYGLQVAHKKAKGAYASDLDALLALAPDGAALRASLAANVDMTTLAVVGDANKFKIELNVLDPERTSIKVRGPVAPRQAAATPAAMPEQTAPLNADGAPLPSGR